MFLVGTVLVVEQLTGDLALAGLAGAAFTGGEIAGQVLQSRALDRFGARAVFPPVALLHLAATGAALALASTPAALIACMLVAGAAKPVIAAYSRSAWRGVVSDPRLLALAASWETLVTQIVIAIGIALLSVVTLLGAAVAALLLAAAMGAAAALTLAAGPQGPDFDGDAPAADGRAGRAAPGGALAHALGAALVPVAGIMATRAALRVGVVGVLAAHGRSQLAGVAFAVEALAGLARAAFPRTRPSSGTTLALALVAPALVLLVLPLAESSAWALVPCLVASGTAMAAVGQQVLALVDERSPDGRRTEGFAYYNVVGSLATVAGSALAGAAGAVALDLVLWLPAAASAAALVAMVAVRRRV